MHHFNGTQLSHSMSGVHRFASWSNITKLGKLGSVRARTFSKLVRMTWNDSATLCTIEQHCAHQPALCTISFYLKVGITPTIFISWWIGLWDLYCVCDMRTRKNQRWVKQPVVCRRCIKASELFCFHFFTVRILKRTSPGSVI